MYPFIHIGRFQIGTFGILLWLAAVSGCWVLYKNFQRKGVEADAINVTALATVAGIIGAKLWHVFESPHLLMQIPMQLLLDRAGFAWFGGLVAAILVLMWQGRVAKVGALGMLDLAAPAAAVGYGVGRIGCLTSGDGDYGIPTSLPWGVSFPHGLVPTVQRVQPTPIYEFIAALLIAWYLWQRGKVDRPGGYDYRRISRLVRIRPLSGRVCSHQSENLFRHEQRPGRQHRLRDCWSCFDPVGATASAHHHHRLKSENTSQQPTLSTS